MDQSVYSTHIIAKDGAIAEEDRDKEFGLTSDIISVWAMVLEAVLLCPNRNASAMYCKIKLVLHNFTLCKLKTQEGYRYVPRCDRQRSDGEELVCVGN